MSQTVPMLTKFTRRKSMDWKTISETSLHRCLSTMDLTALGIGSTLGAGAYVLTGQVARNSSGPAVVVSFLIAALASILAGVCYAEFGARVPKSGSAYVYTYIALGEGLAFVIGWNLILEYVIGTAAVARSFSGYLDSLTGNVTEYWLRERVPMNIPLLASYVDPFSALLVLLVTALLALGVRESTFVNKVFTGFNLLIIAAIVAAGSLRAEPENWNLPAPNVSTCGRKGDGYCGEGGFAPYGFGGIMKGAATAFFAFVGFDAIATTGEEVRNPQRSIPISIVVSLAVVCIVYCGLSITVTMLAPYYAISVDAPFSQAFEAAGWPVMKYVVGVGAACALSTSLLGVMFPMPRIVAAMADDGLLFRWLGSISPRFKTPALATITSGGLAAVVTALFNVDALVDMMSIGTLLAFTLVAMCVLLLRYETSLQQTVELSTIEEEGTPAWCRPFGPRACIVELLNPTSRDPTEFSIKAGKYLTLALVLTIVAMAVVLSFASLSQAWTQALVVLLLLVLLAAAVLMSRQPQNNAGLTFRVPFLPFIPVLSMFVNIYLMVQLDHLTWIRFAGWMVIGFAIYLAYGMLHSSEEIRQRKELIASTIATHNNPRRLFSRQISDTLKMALKVPRSYAR